MKLINLGFIILALGCLLINGTMIIIYSISMSKKDSRKASGDQKIDTINTTQGEIQIWMKKTL